MMNTLEYSLVSPKYKDINVALKKMTRETPEVRSDKRKLEKQKMQRKQKKDVSWNFFLYPERTPFGSAPKDRIGDELVGPKNIPEDYPALSSKLSKFIKLH